VNAADVMTRNVLAVRADAPLVQAVRLMIDNQVSGLPVLDEARRPVGILTEGDLLQRVELGTEGDPPGLFRSIFTPGRLADDYVRTHGRRVSELMTPEIVTISEETPVAEIVRLMRNRRVKRLPVTRDGMIVGIVSRADLLRKLGEGLEMPSATADDADLRERVLAAFQQLSWLPHRCIGISVVEGVVGLDGVIFDARQREAARVAAENVAGVKSVENRLVCIEPSTGMVVIDPMVVSEQVAAERTTR
jgi:CBS domain-containing protein